MSLLLFKNIEYLVGNEASRIRVSGELEAGCILDISGPSGSGKTTLLRILARLKPVENGIVYLKGVPWGDFAPAAWRRRVSYLAQKPVLFDGSVKQNLIKPFELANVKQEVTLNLEQAVEIMEHLYLSGSLLDQDARTLSGGEASRVALVRTLLLNPTVLLLDEPLAALDSKASDAVVDLVSSWLEENKDRGVILVSHTGAFERLPNLRSLHLPVKEGGNGE